MSIADSALVGVERGSLGGEFQAIYILSVPGNDIDCGKKRVTAKERRSRSANNLYPLNHLDIDRKLGSNHCFVVDVVIQSMTVDKQQDSRVVISRPGESPDPATAVVPVVGYIEAANGSENIGKGAVTVFLNLGGSNHRHRGRGIPG